jgi:hypothetical protein
MLGSAGANPVCRANPRFPLFLFSEDNRGKNRGEYPAAHQIVKFCPEFAGFVCKAGKEQGKNRKAANPCEQL